ncbi:hypothetical protein BDV98DRAFT_581542 [Pterulicium gracile]|uniref:Uncharacterized protein n=1 Tax=Pterulicium gracile TaxID=1884261 RepID=A0A5C3QNS1_9AGAR|nr:hypothetical protein BDV98DRAFT_581542 [Pterula gracilis]
MTMPCEKWNDVASRTGMRRRGFSLEYSRLLGFYFLRIPVAPAPAGGLGVIWAAAALQAGYLLYSAPLLIGVHPVVHSVNSNGDDDSPQQRSGAYNLCLNSWTSTGPVMIGLDSTGLELGRNDCHGLSAKSSLALSAWVEHQFNLNQLSNGRTISCAWVWPGPWNGHVEAAEMNFDHLISGEGRVGWMGFSNVPGTPSLIQFSTRRNGNSFERVPSVHSFVADPRAVVRLGGCNHTSEGPSFFSS